MAARIERDFPEYQPVARMAAAALALDEQAQPFEKATPELLAEVIAAHEKVAAFLTPRLKAIELSGVEGASLRAVLSQGDEKL